MLKISTKEDLQRLVDEEIQESLTLDYKASPSLARDDKSRDELCKDVSAFANSAGGQIIYGIVEKDRKPVKVDDGGDLSREWIEQVIDSRVSAAIGWSRHHTGAGRQWTPCIRSHNTASIKQGTASSAR
jgi:predicted HTH transcriptional regulator